jgi:hypothetical protein
MYYIVIVSRDNMDTQCIICRGNFGPEEKILKSGTCACNIGYHEECFIDSRVRGWDCVVCQRKTDVLEDTRDLDIEEFLYLRLLVLLSPYLDWIGLFIPKEYVYKSRIEAIAHGLLFAFTSFFMMCLLCVFVACRTIRCVINIAYCLGMACLRILSYLNPRNYFSG